MNVVIDNFPGESDLVPAPIPANAVLEGDYQDGPNPNGPGYNANQRGDSHLIVWDEDNNIAYEFYFASRPSENTDSQWHAAAESVWNMNTDAFRSLGNTSADYASINATSEMSASSRSRGRMLENPRAVSYENDARYAPSVRPVSAYAPIDPRGPSEVLSGRGLY